MTMMIVNLFLILRSVNFWFAVIIGACVGSFLNVCIFRIPERTFFKNVRSVCPNCQARIPAYYNIPIISFLALRGRAKCCHAPLSKQYIVIEIVTAIIFGLVYLKFPYLGISNTFIFDAAEFARWSHAVTFVSLLLVMSVIDFRFMIIPDELSLGMIALSPVVVAWHPDLDFLSSGLGVLVGGGILYLVAWGYWFIRKQYGLGFGDVKLLAAIGGWLGWQSIFPTLLIGSVVGSIISIMVLLKSNSASFQTKIPFGPFLALGAAAHLFFGPEIIIMLSGG